MPYSYNKPWTKKAAYSKTQTTQSTSKNSTDKCPMEEKEDVTADILARLTDLEDRMVELEGELDELMENAGELVLYLIDIYIKTIYLLNSYHSY